MARDTNGDFYPVPIVDQNTRPGAIVRLIVFIVVLTVAAVLFGIFRDIQLMHETTPLEGPMTDAQKAFLTAQMGRFEAAAKDGGEDVTDDKKKALKKAFGGRMSSSAATAASSAPAAK